jgi:glycosyltransferase involved in cell wall biosynthesis
MTREGASLRAIVMFTPLPPQANGIADYAFELLGPLAHRLRCTVVVEDGRRDARAPAGVEILQRLDYERHADSFADTLHVYHIGNNADHVYMLPALATRPGLIVLHDPALHHLLDCATVARNDPVGYIAALETDYGQAGVVLGEQFRRYFLREQRMYFDLPMLRGLIGPARGVIVHSRFAAAKVLAQVPEARVAMVPHHFCPPPPAPVPPRSVMRTRLGIAEQEVLFLSLGFVGRAKLIDRALSAFAAVRDRLPPFRYVIAGERRRDELDVEELVRTYEIEDRVLLTGYVPEEEFFAYLSAADVVVNLRHPIGGETSGTMVRALGSGACVMLIDRGAFAEVPDDAAAKLPPVGPGFDEALSAMLLRLATDISLRHKMGERARSYSQAHHAIGQTVAGYLDAIKAAANADPPRWACAIGWSYLPPAEHARSIAAARRHLPEGARLPLWFCTEAMPLVESATCVLAIDEDGSVIDLIGPSAAPIPLAVFLAKPPLPRSLDLILIRISDSGLSSDATSLLLAMNRALAFGGLLVLNLERDSPDPPRHSLEDAASGEQLLRETGFRIEFTATAPPPWLETTTEAMSGIEQRCWRAMKVSEFPCRRPSAAHWPVAMQAAP